MLAGYESELNLDDFDTYAEYDEEDEAADEILEEDLKRDCAGIEAELELLRGYAELAKASPAIQRVIIFLLLCSRGSIKLLNLADSEKR